MADVINTKLIKHYNDITLLRRKVFSMLDEMIHLVKCIKAQAQALWPFISCYFLSFPNECPDLMT